MPTLGQGFGRDLVLGTRPVVSVAQQKAYSSWYNRPEKKEDERPEWLMGRNAGVNSQPAEQGQNSRTAGPGSASIGEWKLVWKAKGSHTPTPEQIANAEAMRKSHKLAAKSRPGSALGQISAKGSARRLPADAIQSLHSKTDGAEAPKPISNTLSTNRSVTSNNQKQTGPVAPLNFNAITAAEGRGHLASKLSSRSQISNVSGLSGLSRTSTMSKCTLRSSSSRPKRKRLSTARTSRSSSSLGSYSSLGSSVSAVEHREILKRIEGLEQALKTETELRQRMQSLLEHAELP